MIIRWVIVVSWLPGMDSDSRKFEMESRQARAANKSEHNTITRPYKITTTTLSQYTHKVNRKECCVKKEYII